MDPADHNTPAYAHPLTAFDNMAPLGAHLPGDPTLHAHPFPASAAQSGSVAQQQQHPPPAPRVWHGRLHVRGHRNDMVVAVAAEAHLEPGRAAVGDTRGWPESLFCDATRVRSYEVVHGHMEHPMTQWYVRLAAVDARGAEIPAAQVVQLAGVMIHRQLIFEIPCQEPAGQNGTLYLWGREIEHHGKSILGVFCPHVQLGRGLSPNEVAMMQGMTAGALPPMGAMYGLENMAPLGENLPPGEQGWGGIGGGAGGEMDGGRVWQGILHVRGHANDLVLQCVAVRCLVQGRPAVTDGGGWPMALNCDTSGLTPCREIFQYMNEPTSQWYVRMAAVDEHGVEKREPKLVELVKVLADRLLAFEVACEESGGRRGTLYLWGMEMSQIGHSLLGVFRPHGGQ